jgi:hypothetical protein
MADGAEELKEFLRELPPEARPLFWKLFGRKLVGRHRLREELNTYVVLVKATSAAGSPLNREVARDLARNLAALLKELGDEQQEFDQRLIHAAVRYFIEDDDGLADFDSADGYDDDIEVLNAVAERLGRDDLVIDLLWG